MSYNASIPQPGDLLSASQGQLLVNFDQINQKFGIDHYGLDPATANDGKHKKVTLPEQSSAPTTGADEGAVYTKDVSGVTQLFYRPSNNGTEVQLSGGSTGWTPGTNSGTLLFGGLRINFGSALVPLGPGIGTVTVTFHTPFSAAPYSVNITPNAQGGAGTDNCWASNATATTVEMNQQGPGPINPRTFYYQAIGPA